MIKSNLNNIATMCNGVLVQNKENTVVNGVCIDSRIIKENQLYIPIVGPRFDGHDFLEDAINKGAVASLWQKDKKLPQVDIPLILVDDTLIALQTLATSYRNQLPCKVIGITGSNGKTSTKDIIYQIFSQEFRTYKTQGNKNNEIGLPLTILECDEDIEYLILEMGMSGLKEISLLSNLAKPDIAVITSIGKAHLTDLGGIEQIITAKLEIIEGLNPKGTLIVNGDFDLLKERVKSLNINQEIIFYGESAENDYQITEIINDITGINFTVSKINDQSFECSLIGHHQASNATAAILVALKENFPLESIRDGLKGMDKIKNRLEIIRIENSLILNDSYKSNPESLQAALLTLKNLPQEYTKIAVLADMKDLGDEDKDCHIQISKQLVPDDVDYLYTLGELSKLFNYYERYDNKHYQHFEDKDELANKLTEHLVDRCVILLKGANVYGLWELVDKLKEITK